ncbi:hypothetical protein [Microbacterium sp. SS28]|uniref:hypothetical protein n=1 Tax=Microbacterium sp. SS28 TaxID=2919948 RepID=UPI001FAAB64A|nr:hypothetical protein [Microbacterium sp. SS28]
MAAMAAAAVRAQTILELADAARDEEPIARALRVAGAAGADAASLRDAPLGRLHAAALSFHTALAGARLDAVATCAACGSVVEFSLDADALVSLATLDGPEASGELTVATEEGEWHAAWRAPTAGDLAAVAGRGDAASALLALCCRLTDPHGQRTTDAPSDVVDRVEAQLAAADPLAEVSVAIECPECGTAFVVDVDPIAFVWREVETRARRALYDIDALARAYGWTESEVLGLSEERRAAYLEIVREGS